MAIQVPLIFAGTEGMQRTIRRDLPETFMDISVGGSAFKGDSPMAPVPPYFNPTETKAEPGDFARTSVDDFYTDLLKGILNQPGTNFAGVNQPLEEYRKYAGDLPANAIPDAFTGLVKGVGTASDQQFQDYLKMLQTPSSAEEAIRMTEGDILQQTMKDIDREIARSLADIKLTGEEYGISGAGRLSEPIAAAMGQAQGRGLEQKAGARSQLALSQLQRQAEKDKEVRDAYRMRYERGPVEQMMLAQAYPQFAQLQQGDKELMFKMASAEADRRLQGLQLSSTEKQNLVDNLFKTMLTGLEIQSKENITGGSFDLQKFLQQQQIEWEKQKTTQQLASNEKIANEKLIFQQRQIDEQPGFWENLGQDFLSSTVKGFGGGLGGGLSKIVSGSLF